MKLLKEITTPIAYITTTYFEDPFQWGGKEVDDIGGAYPGRGFSIRSYTYCRQKENIQILMPYMANSNIVWGLYSIGPDSMFLDNGVTPPWDYIQYDSTNGTMSLGNIWRLGP